MLADAAERPVQKAQIALPFPATSTALASLPLEISKIQTPLTEIERVHETKLDEILKILRDGESSGS
ncbi:hypothetical protein ACFWY5_13060 [Nonomuraea sp. NPDC059007]|uniref:hypothetical protein n=1 Tax=Nonomuraea sp. NPDC059007 TaxID=3346692 RepID=UPI00367915A1